ncbi:helix-turn-helix domain-containing protein [Ramlibacter tataouinensis]|uniref:Transcriptional regulators-like protein n=1 Tax=Ramlibacter tataouinensis (strain ATCC BAA-407 / DSM 14655 / LMG 21543 / TTB310) TaxID=365046 RepID=F5XYQ9_RAMTT|nr:helix-turn-helix transcriptional regulator [Ramlibacter tataouinensis]AEG94426.1 transcriptional regulators-like protein [Ramlibacter tataouinensis TTB310]
MAKVPSKALQVLAANLERLIAEHKELNSQPKLAAAAKIDQKTVYRIVTKQNEPSTDKLEKLAKALGVQTWQLLVPGLKPGALPELAVKETSEV